MQHPMNNAPKPGEPIYLLLRHGKLVSVGTNTAKIFSSPEHFDWYRNRYASLILPTDKLVKYVPTAEEEQSKMEENEND